MINSDIDVMLKIKILDFCKHTDVANWYKHFLLTLNWNRQDLENYKINRLRKLLQYSYEYVPYYHKIFQANNIVPNQIKNVADLIKLPVLDRCVIQRENENMISTKIIKSKLINGSSSGTTGVPINYYHDKGGLSAGVAAGYALWHMSGWRPGQRNAHIWGNATSIQRWNNWSSRAKNTLMRQTNIPSIYIDDPEKIESVSKQLIKFDPLSIDGYPGAIFTLAQYFKEKKYILKSLKQVLTTAENLENTQRELIEIQLAQTGDLYGSGEVLGIASRPIGDSKYYILEPHVIVETLATCFPDMVDLVVTDLDNYGMPLIRYKIGDMIDGLFQPEINARYPFAFFNRIIGRDADIILLANGKRFHPVNIFGGTLFRKFPEISKHKTIWNGESLKFVFEISRPLDKKHLHEQLEKLLSTYEVPFYVEFTDKLIPAANGKHRYIEIVNKDG